MKIISYLFICLMAVGCIRVNSNDEEYAKADDSLTKPDTIISDTTKNKDQRVELYSLPLPTSSKVRGKLTFYSGIFYVKGGSTKLFDAAFTFDHKRWKPEISFKEIDSSGELMIRLPKIYNFTDDHNNNRCVLKLNNTLFTDLIIEMGAGVGNFNFKGMNVSKLEANLGAGEFFIDASSTHLRDLAVNAGVGKATIDLSGKRENNLHAEINCGIGQLILFLPKDYSVNVYVTGAIGNIEFPDNFTRKGRHVFNDHFEDSPIKINVDINGGLGSVVLKAKQ
jgi:hypothetical protein